MSKTQGTFAVGKRKHGHSDKEFGDSYTADRTLRGRSLPLSLYCVLQAHRFGRAERDSVPSKLASSGNQDNLIAKHVLRLVQHDAAERVFHHVMGRTIKVADVLTGGLLEVALNLTPAMRLKVKYVRGAWTGQKGMCYRLAFC